MVPNASTLFAADDACMKAGSLFVRAVTAGEEGRASDQSDLIQQAVEHLAAAIRLANPATQQIERAA